MGEDGRKGFENVEERGVEGEGLRLSITEGGKERKSKAITSCKYLEERFQECTKKEGVVLATSVETLVGGPENQNQALGGEGESEKMCDVRFSLMQPRISLRIEEESWRRPDGRRKWWRTVGLKKKTEGSFSNKEEARTGVKIQKPAKAVRCTLLNGSAWCTEKKYMRRYRGAFDIILGVTSLGRER